MPLAALTNLGKADWIDYTDYWREADAEWLQERSILRYATAAARTTDYPTPTPGQVTYRADALGAGLDRLEMYSTQHAKWVPLLMLDNITSTQDNSTGVALSHKLAGGKGIVFQSAQTLFDNPIIAMGGVFGVNATGVTVKTGTKTVKLTTDATSLVSDSPISIPGLTLTGAFSGTAITLSGTLTAVTANVSGTLTGGVVNGTTGTIGSIGLASNIVSIAAGTGAANSAGIQAGQGHFYGDTTSAVMRQRPTAASASGAAYVQTTATVVNLQGTTVEFIGQPKVLSNRSVQYVTTAGTFNGGPVIVQPTDPGVGNVPEGTMWIQA